MCADPCLPAVPVTLSHSIQYVFTPVCLQDYPEGPGVLLELVQNADDAGATKAAFLLDMRQHATSSLLGPGMAAWQGPALLAYNNAIFSPGLL